MSRPVGWGIIGCGDVVERKAGDSFETIPGSRLVAVMRRSASKAEDFARRHGGVAWTSDAKEVLQHPEVDAIYVATPPEHHLAYALEACAAGKACLVEKPAGRSGAELREMIAAFQSADLPLFVSYYRRQLPKFQQVKQILASGRLGSIVSIDYQRSAPSPDDAWRLSARASGGGVFYDIAGHFLDLLDDWFGAIELTGAAASNVLASHEVEDAVALSFRTPGGALGTARWNSAAPRYEERLRIEGLWGRLELECGDCWSPLRVELDSRRFGKPPETALRRIARKLRGKKRPKSIREVHRFTPLAFPHRPMIEHVVDRLARGDRGIENAQAALRATQLMDQALTDYYDGRDDAFWERPGTWKSLRAEAARRSDPASRQRFTLSEEERARFEETGYLGPFACEAPSLDRIVIPARDTGNAAHFEDPHVFEVCAHPGIVHRVAQLAGSEGALLFKSRIRVKAAASASGVPWHQDVGVNNGGYLPGGTPAPTITVWMALDEATRANGTIRVIPGSHRRLYGDYARNIGADLVESGALTGEDLERSIELEARAGWFYLLHSWLLHGSAPNRSSARRAILNMRFAAPGHDVESDFVYIPLGFDTNTAGGRTRLQRWVRSTVSNPSNEASRPPERRTLRKRIRKVLRRRGPGDWLFNRSVMEWITEPALRSQLPPSYQKFAAYASFCFRVNRRAKRLWWGGRAFELTRWMHRRLAGDDPVRITIGPVIAFLDLQDRRFLQVVNELRCQGDTRLIETLVSDGDTFLDVGANHGAFSIIASRRVGPTGRVVAIEPQPRLAAALEHSLATNASSAYEVHAIALGDRDGEVDLLVPSGSSGLAGLFPEHSATHQHRRVRTRLERFDEAMDWRSFPGSLFLKLDIEGSELAFLRGARQMLEARHPPILMEVNAPAATASGTKTDQITDLLGEIGYVAYSELQDLQRRLPLHGLVGMPVRNILVRGLST